MNLKLNTMLCVSLLLSACGGGGSASGSNSSSSNAGAAGTVSNTTAPTSVEATTATSATGAPASGGVNDGTSTPGNVSTNNGGPATDTTTTGNDTSTHPLDNGSAQRLASAGDHVRVVSDGTGNLLVAWLAFDGSAHRVYGRQYLVSGGWQATRILDDSNQDLAEFSLSMAGNGNAILGWVQNDGRGPRATARLLLNGAWQPSQYISTLANNSPGGVAQIQVAIDATGAATAAWVQSRFAGDAPNIYVSRYQGGSGWQAPGFIGGPWGSDPQLAMDGAGNAALAWLNEGVSDHDMHAAYYINGSGWTPTAHLHMGALAATHPAVAISANGTAFAVWTQFARVDAPSGDVFASRYSPSVGWSTPTRIELNDAQSSAQATVAMDASGNAAVGWLQTDGTRYNVYAAGYRNGAWGAAQLLEQSDAPADMPQIAMSADGVANIVWQQAQNGSASIWSARNDTTQWSAAQTLQSNSAAASAPRVAMFDGGKAAFAWQQTDGVWARRER